MRLRFLIITNAKAVQIRQSDPAFVQSRRHGRLRAVRITEPPYSLSYSGNHPIALVGIKFLKRLGGRYIFDFRPVDDFLNRLRPYIHVAPEFLVAGSLFCRHRAVRRQRIAVAGDLLRRRNGLRFRMGGLVRAKTVLP